MDDKFATSAATVPEPCSVLGTSLRPFCLGHHLLFKRLALPFCGSPLADAEWEQIQIGIAICGQEWDETLAQLLNGEWGEVFGEWVSRLEFDTFLGFRFRRKLSKEFLDDATALFRAYLQDGYKKVPVWENVSDKNAISISAPWEMMLRNKLIQNGYSEEDVMRHYLPAAWYDYYTICELNSAKACSDPARWQKVFFTQDDFEREQALKGLQT